MTNEKLAEECRRGARRLEEHGWVQHTMGTRDGRACAVGTAIVVTGGETLALPHKAMMPEAIRLVQHLVAVGGLQHRHQVFARAWDVLVDWNDEEGRTVQEVIDLFAKGEKVALAGFDPDA